MRVSHSLAAPGGRVYAIVAALCTVLAIAVSALAAPAAHAAFTIERCKGAPIDGQGSSAQKEAQEEFWTTAAIWRSSSGCGSSAPSVKYHPEGSGCGIASIGGEASKSECYLFKASETGPGIRAASTRFGGSDAPLTATQQAHADAAGSERPGLIHQIPVAAFAVTIVVHFPDGCKLKDPGTGAAANGTGSLNGDTSTGGPNDPPGGETGDTYANETLRVHITDEELERIWEGRTEKWENIVPVADMETDAKAAKAMSPAECGALPVVRIVRFDGSGTTYNFKGFLSLMEATQGTSGLWTTAPVAGDNTVWPETLNGTKKTPEAVTVKEENGKITSIECKSTNNICTAHAKGGGEVASAVQAINGSIGYVDLATARKKGFYMKAKTDQHTYWIPVQTVSPEEGNKIGTSFVEPTKSPTSNTSASPEGANCLGADYRGYPTTGTDPTLGNWEKAIATGGSKSALETAPLSAYPVCGLTYDFAWDDDATVYGEGAEEQAKARTVKDYLEAVESSEGQYGLVVRDYGVLPANIIKIAQEGVKAIDWKKTAGSGGSKEEVKTPPPAEEKSSGTGSVVTPPSDAFSIAGAKVKGKSIMLSLVLPGPGTVSISAIGGGVKVSQLAASVSGGNGVVTLSISKAALAKLGKVKGHKLVVKITITFTPTGGTGATQVKTITLTQSAPAKKGKHAKHHGKAKHKGKKK